MLENLWYLDKAFMYLSRRTLYACDKPWQISLIYCRTKKLRWDFVNGTHATESGAPAAISPRPL